MTRSSLPALLLAGVAVFTAACAPQTAGQPAAVPHMADDPPLTLSAPENTAPAPAAADPDIARRVARLEQGMGGVEADVAGLKQDVTTMRPRVAKIDAIERHFRDLSLELDRINKTYNMQDAAPADAPASVTKVTAEPLRQAPVPVKPAAAAKPAKKTETVKKAVPVSGPLKVNKVRIGEQGAGKTRIVLDTSAPAKVSYDIDNGEKILVVELPGASWQAQAAQTLKNSALISSYEAESHDGGSRLIVQLKDAAQVLSMSRLDPAEGAGYRVFLDLAKK